MTDAEIKRAMSSGIWDQGARAPSDVLRGRLLEMEHRLLDDSSGFMFEFTGDMWERYFDLRVRGNDIDEFFVADIAPRETWEGSHD